jgi:hypothetical protein
MPACAVIIYITYNLLTSFAAPSLGYRARRNGRRISDGESPSF